jgi:Tol biopolymer transport system component
MSIRSRLVVRSSLSAALALLALPACAQSLSLLGARVVEGNGGAALLMFEARLSAPAANEVRFDFATSDGTATAGSDYSARTVTGLSIPAGQTRLMVEVTVVGDTAAEANEVVNASLANAVGATLDGGTAKGLIINDDHMMLASAAYQAVSQSGSTGYVSDRTAISRDGRFVAFTSTATDLVPGRPANAIRNVYVRDNRTGITTLASTAADGSDGNGESTNPALSADGRYVVFESAATNLVANDTNGGTDLFRRDLQTGAIELVSVRLDGAGPAGGWSTVGSPSADGRYIAFQSTAADVVADDTNGRPDVFVRDMQAGTTVLASIGLFVDSDPDGGFLPSLSADGRYVSFTRGNDVWRRDLQSRALARVTVDQWGGNPDSLSYNAGISADGRYVLFWSWATDFGTPQGTGAQVYVRDVQAGITDLVTWNRGNGGALDAAAARPSMSADGRYVAFQTIAWATDDDVDDTNVDVFVRDRLNHTTVKISKGWNGGGADGLSEFASVSADGHHVAFLSSGTALLPGDGNGQPDVFRAELVDASLPSLSIIDTSVVEGDSGIRQVNYFIGMPVPLAAPVTFDLATADGSAVAGSDFVAHTWTGVTIPAGETSTTVALEIVGDTVTEGYEGFNLYLANVSGARVADGQALVLIGNDDVAQAPMPSLSIGDASIVEGNSGTQTLAFDVTLSAAPTTNVTFAIATANGTALAGTDYVAKAVAGATIPAGVTSYTLLVTVNGDVTYENSETFQVQVSNVSGATVADGSAVGTIANDDAMPSLSIADVSLSEGYSGTQNATFVVTRSGPTSLPVTFDLATADGTATAGTDYVARSLTGLTITPGASTAFFTVAVNGDTAIEANETFQVNLANVAGATVTDGQAVGTIANDDFPPSLSIADVSIAEGNSGTRLATFTVQLSAPATVPVTYDIATANGTATAPADYTAKSLVGQVIPVGATSATFTVSVNGDVGIEPNETFTVATGGVTGATVWDGSAVGTITNDDTLPALSIADVSIAEGNNGAKLATFTISLSSTSATAVSFNAATANGTAVAPGDYAAKSASGLVIAAGALSTTFTVSIKGDKQVEPNETFFVNLGGVAGANLADGQAVGTIVNDDGAALSLARVTTGGLYDDIDDGRGEPVLGTREYALLLLDAARQVCARADGAAIVGVDGVESLAVLADLADAANHTCARQPHYTAAMKADGLGFLVDGADASHGTRVLDLAPLGARAQAGSLVVLADGHARPLTVLLTATVPVDSRERAVQADAINRLVRTRLATDPNARLVVLGHVGLDGLVDLTARALPEGVASTERVWVSAAVLADFADARVEMPLAPKARPAQQVLQLQP